MDYLEEQRSPFISLSAKRYFQFWKSVLRENHISTRKKKKDLCSLVLLLRSLFTWICSYEQS